MLPVQIRPARRLTGTVRVPGDKSISHRAVMLASIAEGTSRIAGFAHSADCLATVECMRALGVSIDVEGDEIVVHGVGKYGLQKPEKPLDCGNSGTTMRLLAGILAGQAFDSVLAGDGSLQMRPMKRIIEPLNQMGAVIESEDSRAPIYIGGGQTLKGIEYASPVASAQVKSCVLLAGLYAKGKTRVIEPTPTRNHTELMLAWLGATETAADTSADGDTTLGARSIAIPGDISSAAYFLVAAACLDGSEIVLEKIGTNETRQGILDVFEKIRVPISLKNIGTLGLEPVADIHVKSGLRSKGPLILSGSGIADVIDEIPVLAVLGTQLENGLDVRDARELRVKESDRIKSVVENLRRMDADIVEHDDGFVVKRSQLKGAKIDSFGDHRIAMAFAIAGLLADGETEIIGAECAEVSFPGFFETLAFVTEY